MKKNISKAAPVESQIGEKVSSKQKTLQRKPRHNPAEQRQRLISLLEYIIQNFEFEDVDDYDQNMDQFSDAQTALENGVTCFGFPFGDYFTARSLRCSVALFTFMTVRPNPSDPIFKCIIELGRAFRDVGLKDSSNPKAFHFPHVKNLDFVLIAICLTNKSARITLIRTLKMGNSSEALDFEAVIDEGNSSSVDQNDKGNEAQLSPERLDALHKLQKMAKPKPAYPGRRQSTEDPVEYLLKWYGDEIVRGSFGTGQLQTRDSTLFYAVKERLLTDYEGTKMSEFFQELRNPNLGELSEYRQQLVADLIGISSKDLNAFLSGTVTTDKPLKAKGDSHSKKILR